MCLNVPGSTPGIAMGNLTTCLWTCQRKQLQHDKAQYIGMFDDVHLKVLPPHWPTPGHTPMHLFVNPDTNHLTGWKIDQPGWFNQRSWGFRGFPGWFSYPPFLSTTAPTITQRYGWPIHTLTPCCNESPAHELQQQNVSPPHRCWDLWTLPQASA